MKVAFLFFNPLITGDARWHHLTLDRYQLAQSVLKIGFALAKKGLSVLSWGCRAHGSCSVCFLGVPYTWQLLGVLSQLRVLSTLQLLGVLSAWGAVHMVAAWGAFTARGAIHMAAAWGAFSSGCHAHDSCSVCFQLRVPCTWQLPWLAVKKTLVSTGWTISHLVSTNRLRNHSPPLVGAPDIFGLVGSIPSDQGRSYIHCDPCCGYVILLNIQKQSIANLLNICSPLVNEQCAGRLLWLVG